MSAIRGQNNYTPVLLDCPGDYFFIAGQKDRIPSNPVKPAKRYANVAPLSGTPGPEGWRVVIFNTPDK